MNDVTDVLTGVLAGALAGVTSGGRTVTVFIDGRVTTVATGTTVIAAIAQAQAAHTATITRRSVTGMLRGPVCGMGICQECRVTIDGRAHQLSCQTLCQSGMDVRTALGDGRS
jgi:predicted molibdopterin-dependent oxidoreductase YjgC